MTRGRVIGMGLSHYGVLVGTVVASRAEGGADTPHFQIRVSAAGTDYRVAVNVLSQDGSELLFLADDHFAHPVTAGLRALTEGFHELPRQAGGSALDFVRANLFDRTAMRPMPATSPGPDNDLADRLAHFVERAAADPGARIYAFGEPWGPEAAKDDAVFGFRPGNGVHDIHMNQGNGAGHRGDDGVWQDGALLLHFPSGDQWVALFLAFQNQTWHTDDTTGHALPATPVGPDPAGSDHRVRVVAALVNPVGPAPEAETVTLLNTTAEPLDLTGWSVLDRQQHAMPLPAVVLPPGDAVRIAVRPPVQLGNGGGLITLLDRAGLKVDGVAYTGDQARAEGRTLVF